jgi:hypothetical protein
MYAVGPGQSTVTREAELEEYLLGRKRVDDLIDSGHKVEDVSHRCVCVCLLNGILMHMYIAVFTFINDFSSCDESTSKYTA